MQVPDWYAILLLGFGCFRIVRLIGYDDLTIPARRWVTGMSDDEHSQWAHVIDTARQVGLDPWAMSVGKWLDVFSGTPNEALPPLVARSTQPTPGRYRDEPYQVWFMPPVGPARYYLSKMLRCPWCLGWWTTLLAWIAWQVWPDGTLIVMSLFAASAIPGLVTKNLD